MEIRSLYKEDCQIEYTLFGVFVIGSDEISNYTESFITQFPNAKCQLMNPFAEEKACPTFQEKYPYASQGGYLGSTISDGDGNQCEIRLLLVLTTDDEGKIIKQKNYYDGESLIEWWLAE